MSISIFFIIFLYLSGTYFITLRLISNPDKHLPRYIGLVLGTLGASLQLILLYNTILTPIGINLSFFNALSLAAWTVIMMLLISSLTKPVDNLGIIIFPIGALAIWLEQLFPNTHILIQSANWKLKLHILASLLAYSLLTLASVQAVLLAIQEHHLHNRHPGGIIRALPPLQTMETLLFEMIGAGFILLTLSLISGFLFLENMLAQHIIHKTILSIFGWILFATLLLGRSLAGWRGRAAITWTLSGFIMLMLAYFGSKAVLELILQRSVTIH